MEKFYRVTLELDPHAGTTIGTAVRDACIMVLTEDRTARLTFNGTQIVITPNEIVGVFVERWSKTREGKTATDAEPLQITT